MPTAALVSPLPPGADARWDYPRALARALAAETGGRWRAELVGIGFAPPLLKGEGDGGRGSSLPQQEPLPPGPPPPSGEGGARTLTPAFPPPRPENALSWQLLDVALSCDVLHLLTAFTRTADLGYVLAQLAGIPVVVTDLGPGGAIGSELKLAQFAAAVVAPQSCEAPPGFAGEVTVIPAGPGCGAALAALYDRLLGAP